MPEIQIRPAISTDIPTLMAIDHSYSSDYAWQMEIQADEGHVAVSFREIHLPRSVRVEYPRSTQTMADDWTRRSGLLVAVLDEEVVGYISLELHIAPLTAWATDLVVTRRQRRQGIGSTLALTGLEWAEQHDCRRFVLEMQPKNYPAIHMAQKLGFDFSGYNDRFYANHDIGLFYSKPLR
jgi:ribosomal protein S18 acetylase RimI-like enzyme